MQILQSTTCLRVLKILQDIGGNCLSFPLSAYGALDHTMLIYENKSSQVNTFFARYGGSGRQSSARIAAFMTSYELFQVNVTKSYSFTDWRNDLKRVLRRAGEDLKPIVFLFGGYQIKVIKRFSCLQQVDYYPSSFFIKFLLEFSVYRRLVKRYISNIFYPNTILCLFSMIGKRVSRRC